MRTCFLSRPCFRTPLILWVGSIFNRRWLDELLGASARLRARWPDLTIEVVGDNRTRPHRDFGILVRDLGIEGSVRLSGFVSEEALALRRARPGGEARGTPGWAAVFALCLAGCSGPGCQACLKWFSRTISALPGRKV